MMPPNLTPEQKEHIRIAQRARMRVEETWQLFTMYLSQEKQPEEALQKAREAVDTWAEWMDANDVDFPDIERPSFATEMGTILEKTFQHLPRLQPAPEIEPEKK